MAHFYQPPSQYLAARGLQAAVPPWTPPPHAAPPPPPPPPPPTPPTPPPAPVAARVDVIAAKQAQLRVLAMEHENERLRRCVEEQGQHIEDQQQQIVVLRQQVEQLRQPPAAAAAAEAEETQLTFTYEHEDGIDADLKCCVCLSPLRDPVVHAACGNMFCAECVRALLRCPLCRAACDARSLVKAPLFVKNKLGLLHVVCGGCGCVVEHGRWCDHAPRCPSLSRACACSDVGCAWTGPRARLAAHTAVCPFVSLRCELLALSREVAQLRAKLHH
eukprot:TRINITY_DN18472_c0_g1_i1.p1 TRINITY_DN18472_c0_g1~~TRINITY_DN18472_c0_g1_i1.p1  ORF type:complete len:291 (-),score=83.63 TRINITY_DN18472_c0_g1_i1:48-869(-)